MIIKISVFALVFLCSLIHSDVEYEYMCTGGKWYKDHLVFIGNENDCYLYGSPDDIGCYSAPRPRYGNSIRNVRNITVDNAIGFLTFVSPSNDGKICSTSACSGYCSPKDDVSVSQGNISNIHNLTDGGVFFIQIGVAFVFDSINFYNCEAEYSGGVVYLDGSGTYSTLKVSNSDFTNCAAVQNRGGAIYISKYKINKLIFPSFLHLKYFQFLIELNYPFLFE
jgi:hypothetical protein